MTRQLLAIGLLLTTFSRGQTSGNEVNQDTYHNSKNPKDTLTISPNKKPDYIVFGRFCRECGGECATMYKPDILNNKLLADHTDSYWEYKWVTPMKFGTNIDNESKILFAKQILDRIPKSILATSKPSERFGCPDCTDGCGIFFETKSDTTIKKFYMDYHTEQLTGDIQFFAEYLKKIIDQF